MPRGCLTWIKAASLHLRKNQSGKTEPVVQAAGAELRWQRWNRPAGNGAALSFSPVRQVTVDQPWIWLIQGLARFVPRLAGQPVLWRRIRHRQLPAHPRTLDRSTFSIWCCRWRPDSCSWDPVVCIGLYEVSRRLERGQPSTLRDALMAWRANAGSIAVMGLVLMLFLLAWIWHRLPDLRAVLRRPAALLGIPDHYAVLHHRRHPVPDRGTLAGGALAVVVFAISAVALPLLLERDAGVLRAIVTSVAAVT